MLGTKPDEGIREPMRWSADKAAAGQTTWEPDSNNAGHPGINVESQLHSSEILLSLWPTNGSPPPYSTVILK